MLHKISLFINLQNKEIYKDRPLIVFWKHVLGGQKRVCGFEDFPALKFVIPHGGGAVPFHWGRYRGLAQDMGIPSLEDHLLNNVFFDTCVYHQPGIDCMTKVIPAKNILFASEMIGAVRGIDPETGHNYDDTKRYIDATPNITDDERAMIFEQNIKTVYPRLVT